PASRLSALLFSSPCRSPPSSRPASFFFSCTTPRQSLHSFPTRRSSDLIFEKKNSTLLRHVLPQYWVPVANSANMKTCDKSGRFPDRKSTRLNSSHVSISYAVFCLKQKTRMVRLLFCPGRSRHLAPVLIG